MMAIEITRQLIDAGAFEEALNTQWNSIDSGDEEARLDLANLHDDLGLHYFAQDQYLHLIENAPDFELEAGRGAIQNYVWFREYGEARDLLTSIPGLQGDLKPYVDSSEANFSTLVKDVDFIEELVSSIFSDLGDVQSEFVANLSLENLQTKLIMEEWLMNIAIDLSNNPKSALAALSIELSIGGPMAVQRPLNTIVGSEIERARDYLQTSADAIGVLSNLPEFALRGNPIFQEACAAGKKAANKLIWLITSEDRKLSPEESQAIENICWGLQRMGNTSEGFAAFVLAGATE